MRCWDCSSKESLTHEGGGDSQTIANVVKYALTKYKGDPSKVFATGSSSGGMFTNVLMATYPDVFAGGASFSGVAAGCLKYTQGTQTIQGRGHSSPMSDKSGCPMGQTPNMSAEYWAKLAQEMYPGYSGTRPKIQIWHGTADGLVKYRALGEALKQWSTVMALTFTRNQTNVPQAGYTELVYGDGTRLQGYSAQGVGHVVPQHPKQVLQFFGLL
jgi:acetylxylan esterase